MEFDQLEAFVTLSKTKNFSRTAEILHIVQSAVSTRIRLLEETIGKSLFERNHRTVRLTDAGILLLPRAEDLLQKRREILQQLRGEKLYVERLRIAAPDCLWKSLLLDSVSHLSHKYPSLAFTAHTAHSHQVIEKLQANQIDIGVVLEKPRITGIDVRKLGSSKIILIGSSKTKIHKKPLNVTDLKQLSFISLDWQEMMDHEYRAIFADIHFPRVQLDQLDMILEFVKKGNGVAFVPEFAAKPSLASQQLIKIPIDKALEPPPWQTFFISRKSDRNRNSIESVLRDIEKLF